MDGGVLDHTEETISFAAQVVVVFLLFVHLEGQIKDNRRVAATLEVKIKALFRDVTMSIPR